VDHLFRINDLAGILAAFAAFSEILIQDQWVIVEWLGIWAEGRRFPGCARRQVRPPAQAGKCGPVI